MLALGIQGSTDFEHTGRAIHQDHLETRFEIRRIIAPSAAEFQQRMERSSAGI
jgi:hypothetical protein